MEANQAVENLKLVLSSPRPRSPDTIRNYLSVANHFMSWLGDGSTPTDKQVRQYFIDRRQAGMKESTLQTTYAVLQKLFRANSWEWPFTKEDRPEKTESPNTPGFTAEEVEQLISHRDDYSKAERFYLAIATTFAPRRIELARIRKVDIKGNTIKIDTAKKGEKRIHLLPDEIMPYIEDYRPRQHDVSALSYMFVRVCKKGLGERKRGYGWHSFRRTLVTMLPVALAKADKSLTYAGYFLRWSRRTTGATFLGVPMAGDYTRPELLSSDPFFIDREVFEVHPFIKLWQNGTDDAKS